MTGRRCDLRRLVPPWRGLTSTLVALALAGPQVRACEAPVCKADEIRIEVLPFDVTEEFSVPYAELGGTATEVGLVRQTTTVKIEACRATVGYANPVLMVASELRRDACAFQLVLEHERRHVEIYRLALIDLEQRIRAAASHRPLFDAAVKEVTAVDAVHDAFDSGAEYRKNVTACRGRIYKLALHRSLLASAF
jgi:hypothetical protein